MYSLSWRSASSGIASLDEHSGIEIGWRLLSSCYIAFVACLCFPIGDWPRRFLLGLLFHLSRLWSRCCLIGLWKCSFDYCPFPSFFGTLPRRFLLWLDYCINCSTLYLGRKACSFCSSITSDADGLRSSSI